jgi:hypothetical protein
VEQCTSNNDEWRSRCWNDGKMDAPYIQYTKNEAGQVEMLLDASWWDAEHKEER